MCVGSRWVGHEGTRALAGRDQSLTLQLGDGAAHGDAAQRVLVDELGLGRESVTGAKLAALDAVAQDRPQPLIQGRPTCPAGGLLLHADTL